MKKITTLFVTTLVAATLFIATNSSAQTTNNNGMAFKVGIGLNGGLFRKDSPMQYAYGADLRLQYDLTKDVAITATGGYVKLMGRNNVLDVDFIPVKGGVKVFAIERMYLSTEAGAGFAIKSGSKTNFIYSGGFGYEWKKGLDIGVRYEGYTNDIGSATYFRKTGQYALRLAYNFKL